MTVLLMAGGAPVIAPYDESLDQVQASGLKVTLTWTHSTTVVEPGGGWPTPAKPTIKVDGEAMDAGDISEDTVSIVGIGSDTISAVYNIAQVYTGESVTFTAPQGFYVYNNGVETAGVTDQAVAPNNSTATTGGVVVRMAAMI